MNKTTVIRHFGSPTDTARALGISVAAVGQWKAVIPEGSAYKVQVVTRGKLRVNPKVYEGHNRKHAGRRRLRVRRPKRRRT